MNTLQNINNSERENRVYNDAEIREALVQLAKEIANPINCEGARFKIGDRVRMKHDGATGTVVRVTEGLPDVRFNYEVTRDIPVEGFEPGIEIWTAFPVEDGLELLEPAPVLKDDYKPGDRVRHNQSRQDATVTAVREAQDMKAFGGRRRLYTLDFGQSVFGPFHIDLNGGEFLCEALEPVLETSSEITDSLESRKRTIVSRAQEGKQAWRYYKGYEVRVRTAYKNGHNDPEGWSYCVSWYEGEQLLECENGVSLEQAARAMEDLPRWADSRKSV